jgi:hypothetical protein
LVNVGDPEATQNEEALGSAAIDAIMNADASAPAPAPAPTQAAASQEASQEDDDQRNVNLKEEEKQKRKNRRDFFKDVAELGQQNGAAATSTISLAETVTDAAANKTIGLDDAEEIYEKFRAARDNRATLEDGVEVPDEAMSEAKHGAAASGKQTPEQRSRTTQIGKLKAFIRLGNQMEEDAGEIVRRARNVHLDMLATQRETTVAGSTYTIMCRVAVEQLRDKRAGKPMSDADMYAFLTADAPRETGPADGIKKLIDALNSATAAKRGGKEREPIDSEDLVQAIEHLRNALHTLAPERAAELDAKLAKQDEKQAASQHA